MSYAFFKEHNPTLDSQINLKSEEEDNKLIASQFKKLYLMLGAVSVDIIMLFICILCQTKLSQNLADQIIKILTFLLPLILSVYSGYMLINFIFYKKPLPSPIIPPISKEQTNLYIQAIDVVAYLVAFGFSVFFTCMLFGYFWLNL